MPSSGVAIPRPHSGQVNVLNREHHGVVYAGRRWGKTQVGVLNLLREATEVVGLYWWVGLSWRSASMERAWRLIKFYVLKIWRQLNKNGAKYIRESSNFARLPNGSEIWMRTAENPTSLAGEGVKGVIIDEFTLMDESVWTEYLDATLIDSDGWALFMGVPKGEGWHSEIWHDAQKLDRWEQFHFTSYDNPTIPDLEQKLNERRERVPDRIWRQEYMAEIVSDAGRVFRNLDACIMEPDRRPEYNPQLEYAFGVDFARDNDYTVIAVWECGRGRLVHIERFNKISYPEQIGLVVKLQEYWKPIVIVAEATGVGQAVIDHMVERNLPVVPFHTTNATKRKIIDALQIDIEYAKVKLVNDPALIKEFKAYSIQQTDKGMITYAAPYGAHDDIVMAAAIGYTEAQAVALQIW